MATKVVQRNLIWSRITRKPYHKMFTVSYVMSLSIKNQPPVLSVLKEIREHDRIAPAIRSCSLYLFCYSVNSPSRIRTTRSQYFNKRSSCVTMIIPLSFSLASFASNLTTSNAFSVSKLAVGSSAKITSGS